MFREIGKAHYIPPEEKKKIVEKIRRVLSTEENIVFATIFGGFLENRAVHDIDIAVYLAKITDFLEDQLWAQKLSQKLSKTIKLPVDIIILNYAPLWLTYRALKNKIILVDKNPILRTQLYLTAIDNKTIATIHSTPYKKNPKHQSNSTHTA
ncbi:MAG TPA: nucleotidyltransferase domain-containing protein [Thermoprotei archaeon]|nr:nucleotidyltransferase domain-containing protein [Thermoprotei archaeon]